MNAEVSGLQGSTGGVPHFSHGNAAQSHQPEAVWGKLLGFLNLKVAPQQDKAGSQGIQPSPPQPPACKAREKIIGEISLGNHHW